MCSVILSVAKDLLFRRVPGDPGLRSRLDDAPYLPQLADVGLLIPIRQVCRVPHVRLPLANVG
jgi:hypothetical protein